MRTAYPCGGPDLAKSERIDAGSLAPPGVFGNAPEHPLDGSASALVPVSYAFVCFAFKDSRRAGYQRMTAVVALDAASLTTLSALDRFRHGRSQDSQIGHELRAVMHFVLVDAHQNDSDFPPEAQFFVNALFIPSLDGEGRDGGQRLTMDPLEAGEFLFQRMRCADHGAQSFGDALLVIREVSFKSRAAHTFLGNPQMTNHFADGQRVFFRPPTHMFRLDHSHHLASASTNGFLLFQEKALQIHERQYSATHLHSDLPAMDHNPKEGIKPNRSLSAVFPMFRLLALKPQNVLSRS